MKLPNRYGSITKLSGKRRKPYIVRITTGYEIDPETLQTKQIRKNLGYYSTRKEAMQALADYNSSPYDLNSKDITFSKIYNIWSEKKFKKLSESSISCYSAAYSHCKSIMNTPIKDLKTHHLQSVIDDCELGFVTKQNIKVIMNGIFDYALQNDLVAKNYATFLETGEKETILKRVIFSKEEINKLWSMSERYDVKIVLILLYSGMRVNELLQMPRECCNLKERYLDIKKAKNKSSIRKVPIHDKIFPFIQEFYEKEKCNLVTNDNGSTVLYNNFVSRDFKKMMKELGAEHKLHDTRHTFITNAREAKIDDLCLKLIVGHTPTDITKKVYTHVAFEELLKEINKL